MFGKKIDSPLVLVAIISLLINGCGEPTPVQVTGTVKYRGKPMPGLVVHFVPESGNESRGTTNDQGEFKLNYQRGVDGALRGKHKVYFEYRFRSPQDEVDIQSGKSAIPADVKALLDTAGSLAKTPLSYEVTKNNQQITIELE